MLHWVVIKSRIILINYDLIQYNLTNFGFTQTKSKRKAAKC